MTATSDPFTTQAGHPAASDMLAADRMAEAGTLLDRSAEQCAAVDSRRTDWPRSGELLLQYAALNLQRAQTAALLAIAHEMAALRSDVHAAVKESTAAAVDTGDSLTDAVRDLADVLDRPRWWQWRLRRAIRRQSAQPDIEP
jgi:hypothetical protein